MSSTHKRHRLVTVLAVTASMIAGTLVTARAQGTAMINFLNPSSHSTILSDQPTSAPPGYHLVAWARNTPGAPLVEFELQAAGEPAITIGTANRPSPDTFQHRWDIPESVEDGAYTLRAILYSGATGSFQEVARDEIAVEINHMDDPFDPSLNAAGTVELTYPSNAGPAGTHTPQGGFANVVADVAPSEGVTRVRAFYTTSLPGTEPEWKVCGTETTSQAGNGLRCTVIDSDPGMAITAIAVVANETPLPPPVAFNESLNGAGDAHRVFPYVQDPTSMTAEPPTQRIDAGASGAFACSELVVFGVADQNGRPIAAFNIDVHGKGPTDQLAFDTSGGVSPNQPPDLNHNAPEPAFNCSTGSFGGSQGDHNLAGEPDIKHIESTVGTTDAGTFTVRLQSDASGITNLTAWADELSNEDLRCTQEASVSAAIGWGQDAFGITAIPAEQTACGDATPPPPTTEPTTTSPSPPPMTSPPPTTPTSPTTTSEPSPTETSTGTPTPAGRDISLEVSRNRLRFNKPVTFSGSVNSSASASTPCTAVVEVVIERDVIGGSNEFEEYARTTTDQSGLYSITRTSDRSANYVARVAETPGCDDAASNAETVLVRKKVRLKVSDRTPRAGSRVRFKVTVLPCLGHERDRVVLSKVVRGKFAKVKSKRTNTNCRAKFTRRPSRRSAWSAFTPKQDPDHVSGRSRTIRIRPH